MVLHLIKLCVGADTVEDVRGWAEERSAETARRTGERTFSATTRMFPKRISELLPGGSIYWIVKGAIAVRAPLVDIRSMEEADGSKRCEIVMVPDLVLVRPRQHRPFQGWRYLTASDAPPDSNAGAVDADIPAGMRRELAALCLI